MLQPAVRLGLGLCAEAVGAVGAASLDSIGDLVPPRSLDLVRDGAWGWYPRAGIAYVSNVAVLPAARRRGVAQALMAAAEQQAQGWGCRAVGLHCNPRNTAAMGLYRSLGYRLTPAKEPVWMPWLQGRPPDRCVFLIKRLSSTHLGQPTTQLVAAV
ncbi:acyl-CoA N-acyltransferase, partial [Haematococcus lacustris]